MTPKEYLSNDALVEQSKRLMRALIAVAELAPAPAPEPSVTFLCAALELMVTAGFSKEEIIELVNDAHGSITAFLAHMHKPALEVVR